jgi:glycosyltransferase involved in cell wall biosynthesis
MSKNIPKVTILIPVKSLEYLFATLTSVSFQTLPLEKFEVLLISDRAPIDEIRKIASIFSFEYRILESTNPGIVPALNLGIEATDNDFIARMDADDLMIPNRLESQLSELIKRDDLVGIGGGMIFFDNDSDDLGRVCYPKSNYAIKRILPYKNVFGHPTMMLRTSAVRQVGMYRQVKSEDWDLWNRLIEIGKMTNLRLPVIKYRLHSQQISQINPSVESEISMFIQLSKKLRAIGNEDFPGINQSIQEWIESLGSNCATKGLILRLDRQQKRRILAQSVLAQSMGRRKHAIVIKLFQSMRASLFEVLLTLLQKVYRYI